MAIYHCSVKTISRNQGRSAVGAVAYRAGEKLYNSYDGILHDYTRKRNIEYSEIILPNNAPKEYLNREKLWNSVELAEKRINSRTAREVEVALPIELSRKQQIKLLQEYARENFIKKGMCVDFSIHDKDDGNPHAHIMLTTRNVSQDGFTSKNRDWDKKENLEQWRKNWEIECNKNLGKYGFEERIDHRSYKDQGINKQPTIHLGVAAKMKKSDRGRINEEIKKINNEIEKLEKEEKNKEYIKVAADEVIPLEPEKEESKTPDADVDFVENKTNKLYELTNMYLQKENEIQTYKDIKSEIQREIRELNKSAEKMLNITNRIILLSNKNKELKEKKQGLGLFKGREKKQIESQIKDFENEIEEERKLLYLEFGITSEQTINKLNEIENQKKELNLKIPSDAEIEVSEKAQLLIEIEYKKEKILIDNSPFKQDVENKLKERKMLGFNLNDMMNRAKTESKLKHITKLDLNLIIKYHSQNKELIQIIENMQKQKVVNTKNKRISLQR